MISLIFILKLQQFDENFTLVIQLMNEYFDDGSVFPPLHGGKSFWFNWELVRSIVHSNKAKTFQAFSLKGQTEVHVLLHHTSAFILQTHKERYATYLHHLCLFMATVDSITRLSAQQETFNHFNYWWMNRSFWSNRLQLLSTWRCPGEVSQPPLEQDVAGMDETPSWWQHSHQTDSSSP